MNEKTTKIASCYCNNAYQDKKYGVGKRVFNQLGKDENQYKCTCCGVVRDIK